MNINQSEVDVTVVIPLYNKSNTIRYAVESVLNQTKSPREIIVVNDGSTDNSLAKLKEVMDPKLKLITQKNSGVSAARNVGIDYAISQYVAFLDADDFWEPKFLETFYKDLLLNDSEVEFWSCAYNFYRNSEKIPAKFSLPKKMSVVREETYYLGSLKSPLVTSSSSVVSKKLLLKIKGFPAGVSVGEDLITWSKIIKESNLYFNDAYLSNYRFVAMNSAHVNNSKDSPPHELISYFANLALSNRTEVIIYHQLIIYRSARIASAFKEKLNCLKSQFHYLIRVMKTKPKYTLTSLQLLIKSLLLVLLYNVIK